MNWLREKLSRPIRPAAPVPGRRGAASVRAPGSRAPPGAGRRADPHHESARDSANPSRRRAGRSSPPVPRRRNSTRARSPCIRVATTSRRRAKFREFVAVYPDHKLAGNAQYWIGECLYSQRRFAEAAEEFAKVETDYPASHKIPAALLKKGLSLEELKRMPEAQAVLQQLVERYGKSEEAAKAKEKLERWKQP